MLHINHQWDLEYREQQESYDRYRADAQQIQHENQDTITELKAEKETLVEQSKQIRREKERTEKKLNGKEQVLANKGGSNQSVVFFCCRNSLQV